MLQNNEVLFHKDLTTPTSRKLSFSELSTKKKILSKDSVMCVEDLFFGTNQRVFHCTQDQTMKTSMFQTGHENSGLKDLF